METKRPPGRPRKHPLPDPNAPKRGPGRPRKDESPDPALLSVDQIEQQAYVDSLLNKPPRIGRKPLLEADEDTLRTIAELAKLFCTQSEAAGFLGVSLRTFQNFLADNEQARETWDDGLQHAKISLRRKQLALADKNAPAAIFLGKNYLGQKDEHHTTTTVNKPANELTEAELMEIATGGRQGAPRPAKAVH